MLDKINALVDGQLPMGQRAAVLAQLAGDPPAKDTHLAWQAQRETLRALHRPLLDEAVPDSLLTAASRVQFGRHQRSQWSRWGGMAAALVLAFGVGWLSHGRLAAPFGPQLAGVPARSAQAFVHQASLAHAVYSPELRHPVEVPAAQQEHLVQWLSKRLGKPLKVPVLAAQGYELVGGRLLPGEGGARAQFMFQNPSGDRITLYLGALEGSESAPAGSRETAFRYSAEGPVPSFYWVDQGFGYALSGAVSREELMKLSDLVHQQL
jgi:anti-sigma factor RsiW